MKGAPYFGVYNVGEYTFMPWKVVWPEMSSRFYAAVVGDAEVPVAGMRPYVPDHKVYYSAFERKEEAFYLCGLLNTPMVAEWIESHTVNIQVGNIFKHTHLPEFEAGNKDHIRLAALTETAHATHEPAKRAEIIAQISALGEEILHYA